MDTRIEITKVRVKDGKAKIEWDEVYQDGQRAKNSREVPYQIHQDFRDALDSLKPHLVKLCDQREGDVIKKRITGLHEESFSNIRVTGFTIAGTGEDEGVCIVGVRLIRAGKQLPLTSPFETWEGDYTEYSFRPELQQAIIACQAEAIEYLFNDKHSVTQTEMNFNSHAEDMEG